MYCKIKTAYSYYKLKKARIKYCCNIYNLIIRHYRGQPGLLNTQFQSVIIINDKCLFYDNKLISIYLKLFPQKKLHYLKYRTIQKRVKKCNSGRSPVSKLVRRRAAWFESRVKPLVR